MKGVIEEISSENRSYYKASDVMAVIGVSRDKAYKIIKSLRDEAINQNYLPNCYPAGRIPKAYFNRRMMIG